MDSDMFRSVVEEFDYSIYAGVKHTPVLVELKSGEKLEAYVVDKQGYEIVWGPVEVANPARLIETQEIVNLQPYEGGFNKRIRAQLSRIGEVGMGGGTYDIKLRDGTVLPVEFGNVFDFIEVPGHNIKDALEVSVSTSRPVYRAKIDFSFIIID